MKQQTGFSLIELLLAMAVFSASLLIVTMGFINIVRIHQAGLSSRATQQNARLALDDVTKQARNAAAVTVINEAFDPGGAPLRSRVCLQNGSQILMYRVNPANGNLMQGTTNLATCPVPASMSTWRKVNDSSVRLTRFAVDSTGRVGTALGTMMVTLTVVSNNDLNNLNPATGNTTCKPGPGSQFCAVTTLSSTAKLRGGTGL